MTTVRRNNQGVVPVAGALLTEYGVEEKKSPSMKEMAVVIAVAFQRETTETTEMAVPNLILPDLPAFWEKMMNKWEARPVHNQEERVRYRK